LRIKVLNNLARRAAESLRAEMHVVGPVKLHEVEAAQREILRTVLRLEQSGQLFISGRGREENRIFY
jgi:flagellar motor switch protein FliG